MIASARDRVGGPGDGSEGAGETYEVADLRDWLAAPEWPGSRAGERSDVLVTNATLQWLPDPLDLLPAMVGRVAPGGVLAIGVPANFDEPSHVLRRELAAEAPYAAHTAGVASPWSPGAMAYLEALTDLGCEVDAWETTYLHVLEGEDAVFEWISGTGARPTLQALPAGSREEFAGELRRRLRAAYPPRDGRVVLPFRRAFAVARVPA
jgi:trans-aconitate 2-methyltransferase